MKKNKKGKTVCFATLLAILCHPIGNTLPFCWQHLANRMAVQRNTGLNLKSMATV
ncbi:hypothetical protein HCG69_14400 [Bacteroides sp. K03]|uniref:hypothetical protein n=1 Tax=Bacteroides TaxID=816 RepID=UPI001C8C1268|nr:MULTISPECIES: hypothetical protein [Bacteroides]MBX9189246.1 hypothetical protein [Bacteroides sp. K03]